MKHSLSLIKPGFWSFKVVESYLVSWRWRIHVMPRYSNALVRQFPGHFSGWSYFEPSDERLREDMVNISTERDIFRGPFHSLQTVQRLRTLSISKHNIMKVDVLRGYDPGSLDLQGLFSNLALAFHRLSQNQRSVLAINTKRAILKETPLTGHQNL